MLRAPHHAHDQAPPPAHRSVVQATTSTACHRGKVVAMLEPSVRPRLEAAVNGNFVAIHVESVADALLQAARNPGVRAVLVSLRALPQDQERALGALETRCPGVMAIAMVADHTASDSERLLQLGAHGIRRFVDVSAREGWTALRQLLGQPQNDVAAAILAHIKSSVGSMTPGAFEFFDVLVRNAPEVQVVKAICRCLRMQPTTLISRFVRAGLPSPKCYLATVRLTYAAAYLELPSVTVSDVAYRLRFACPQSFGRHLRVQLGLTAREFRSRYGLATALDRLLDNLFTPYAVELQKFDPLRPV